MLPDGTTSEPQDLPCWYDSWRKEMEKPVKGGGRAGLADVEAPEVFMSVVVPAYNEEERLSIMLEEAVDYLELEYGTKSSVASSKQKENGNGANKRQARANGTHSSDVSAAEGWEIIVVSDGSTDDTISTALSFARTRTLPPGSIRVVKLEENRGKGGAVIHGMRHVRGKYVIFADADGASKFDDLRKIVAKAHVLEERDPSGRAVVIGSRAHLVGSEAVVKVGHLYADGVQLGLTSPTAVSPPQRAYALIPPLPLAPHASRHIPHR